MQNTNNNAENKTKIKNLVSMKSHTWQPDKMEEYLKHLTCNQASAIIRARTKTIACKANHNSSTASLATTVCNLCDLKEKEDQIHLLCRCPKIHIDESLITEENEYFSDDIDAIRNAANKINKIIVKKENIADKKKWKQGPTTD